MDLTRIILLVFVTCVREHVTQTITGTPITVNVYEEERSQIVLTDIVCTHTGPIRVDMGTVNPTSPCGGCFAVYKVAPSTNFQLFFLPSQGNLSYANASRYNVNVTCTDDVTSTSTIINVRVRTNEPPNYGSSSDTVTINAQTTVKGFIIYNVIDATDPDGDVIFYNMSVSPVSSAYKYEIGLTDGKIRTTVALASECFPSLTLFVFIHDYRNVLVGPKVIAVQFSPYFTVPHISNLNKEIYVSEGLAIGDTVGPTDITATHNSGTITYIIETYPTSFGNLFEISTGTPKIRLKNKLNYEHFVKNINVTIKPTNECTPDEFFLYIRILDANDPPVLTPRDIVTFENEGTVNYNAGFVTTDEDDIDSYTYSIINSNAGNLFYIIPSTGIIMCDDYNRDDPTNPAQVILTIQTTDSKGPDSDNTTVTINFRDINDNPPIFAATDYRGNVEDCTPPGAAIVTVVATDNVDSAYDNNNVVECIPNSNGYLTVLTSCSVILTASMPAGTVSILNATARDLGTVPAPQTSISVPVIVTSVACTTTSTVTPGITTTTTATTVTTTTTTSTTTLGGIDQLIPVGSENGNDGTSNIWWIVIACIAGCILLACAGFFISRYIMPRCQGSRSKQFKPGSGANNNKTNPGNKQQNQARSNTQRNAQTPVTPREVKPFEPKKGPEDYRMGNAENRGNYHHKQNVWHGMGPQPGKGFDL